MEQITKINMYNWYGFCDDTRETWKSNINNIVSYDENNISTNINRYDNIGKIVKVSKKLIYVKLNK